MFCKFVIFICLATIISLFATLCALALKTLEKCLNSWKTILTLDKKSFWLAVYSYFWSHTRRFHYIHTKFCCRPHDKTIHPIMHCMHTVADKCTVALFPSARTVDCLRRLARVGQMAEGCWIIDLNINSKPCWACWWMTLGGVREKRWPSVLSFSPSRPPALRSNYFVLPN